MVNGVGGGGCTATVKLILCRTLCTRLMQDSFDHFWILKKKKKEFKFKGMCNVFFCSAAVTNKNT